LHTLRKNLDHVDEAVPIFGCRKERFMDEPAALAKAAAQSNSSSGTGIQIPARVPPIDAREREKFEFEKEQQLAEAARLSEDLKIKQRGSAQSRWTNPFIVAIIDASAVGLGNVAGSVLNSKYQRELGETTNRNLGYLESIKSENTSVLEVAKLGDAEKVRAGLCLLYFTGT
jgi:hypothetical protein